MKKFSEFSDRVGRPVALSLVEWAKKHGGHRRLPTAVRVSLEKPAFHLNDGDVLHALGIDLVSGRILGEMYCGSGDSAINDRATQFSTGGLVSPKNQAVVFITSYWNGRNTSWTLLFVTDQIRPALGSKS